MERETKSEQDHSDFVRGKCQFEGLISKNAYVVKTALLSYEMKKYHLIT